MKQAINTDLAPAPVGPYSRAIRAGGLVHFAGQIGLDPASGQMVSGGAGPQTEQVFRNIQAVAKASGGSLNEIVSLTVYLTALSDIKLVNEAITRYFREPWPARTSIQVAALPMGALVEITAIMVI